MVTIAVETRANALVAPLLAFHTLDGGVKVRDALGYLAMATYNCDYVVVDDMVKGAYMTLTDCFVYYDQVALYSRYSLWKLLLPLFEEDILRYDVVLVVAEDGEKEDTVDDALPCLEDDETLVGDAVVE